MAVHDVTIAKIQRLPELLIQEVNDFMDFLLMKHDSTRWQLWTHFNEALEISESDFSDYLANAASPHTIIAPFTTGTRRALLPSHVFVPAGAGGLSQDSVVLCEQIRVIDKRRIIRVLGHLMIPACKR